MCASGRQNQVKLTVFWQILPVAFNQNRTPEARKNGNSNRALFTRRQRGLFSSLSAIMSIWMHEFQIHLYKMSPDLCRSNQPLCDPQSVSVPSLLYWGDRSNSPPGPQTQMCASICLCVWKEVLLFARGPSLEFVGYLVTEGYLLTAT